MQLGAGDEGILLAAPEPHLFGEFRVTGARGVAHPGEYAAGLIDAYRVDELLAQGRQGGGVHQEHAVFVEPDQPLVGAKANEITQVAIRRVSGGAHVVSSGLLRCSVEVVMTGKIGRGSGCFLLYHAHRPAFKGSVHSLGL